MTKRAVKRSPLQRRQQVGRAHRGQGGDPSTQGSAPKINQSINQSIIQPAVKCMKFQLILWKCPRPPRQQENSGTQGWPLDSQLHGWATHEGDRKSDHVKALLRLWWGGRVGTGSQ